MCKAALALCCEKPIHKGALNDHSRQGSCIHAVRCPPNAAFADNAPSSRRPGRVSSGIPRSERAYWSRRQESRRPMQVIATRPHGTEAALSHERRTTAVGRGLARTGNASERIQGPTRMFHLWNYRLLRQAISSHFAPSGRCRVCVMGGCERGRIRRLRIDRFWRSRVLPGLTGARWTGLTPPPAWGI